MNTNRCVQPSGQSFPTAGSSDHRNRQYEMKDGIRQMASSALKKGHFDQLFGAYSAIS
jgi:hypothetical protein